MSDHLSEDETGYVMADLVTAFLFVVMIALVAYVITFYDRIDDQERMSQKMHSYALVRHDLLQRTSEALEVLNISHDVDWERDILRFDANDLSFGAGDTAPASDSARMLHLVGYVLSEVTDCYDQQGLSSRSSISRSGCQAGFEGSLEGIAIEGHTDNTPVVGSGRGYSNNLELSVLRAKSVYDVLSEYVGENRLNAQGERMMSVVGYGENRPVNAHTTPTPDASNRRIDIRFNIARPWASQQ